MAVPQRACGVGEDHAIRKSPVLLVKEGEGILGKPNSGHYRGGSKWQWDSLKR